MDQALKCPCCNKRVSFKELQKHQKERCPETATGLQWVSGRFRALGLHELPEFRLGGLGWDEEISAVLRKVVSSASEACTYIPIRIFIAQVLLAGTTAETAYA